MEGGRLEDARILVVDDEVAHTSSLERLFSREGAHVLAANSGADALEIIRTEPVQIGRAHV